MAPFSIFVLVSHYALVAVLCVYGAHRFYHTFLVRRSRERSPARLQSPIAYPTVTVQAPVYNEKFVVERLIDALAAMDYPADRLQIQIVDDSTDDSVEIAARRIAYHRARGVSIDHVRRDDRRGFKAGALQAALPSANGEFIAIFDADFLPSPDFLKRIMPNFDGEDVGMVQAQWRYLNPTANLLTRVQTIILDAHFAIEQVARFRTGAFFNFNGTAGVWRKTTIADAGGWRADTLTEDLDLSYRAQMKGWRFIYAHDVGCASEVPIDMRAFKTQQHRWAKGAIEVMRKSLAQVWRSPHSLHAKIEATFHLTGNISYLLMLVDALFFLLPAVHIREQAGWSALTWLDIPLFFFASLSHAWFFLYSQKLQYGRVAEKLRIMPTLLATSIGLSVNNGRAVIEALAGHRSEFVRTPKTGANAAKNPLNYKAMSAQWADYLELALTGVYLVYFIWAAARGYWVVLPFIALFMAGFFFTGLSSILARQRAGRALAPDAA